MLKFLKVAAVSIFTVAMLTAMTLAALYSFPPIRKDVDSLAFAFYHEARGESLWGIIGVGNVILNRVESRAFPDSIWRVITQGEEKHNKCQFSFYCEERSDNSDRRVMNLMRIVAFGILVTRFVIRYDNIDGALYYFNIKKLPKCWEQLFREIPSHSIGNHTFFKQIPWGRLKKRCRTRTAA